MERSFAELLRQRRSTRAFTDQPVERETVEKLLRAARLAPSGANLQPGSFHALAGSALDALKKELAQALADNRAHDAEYSYFPEKMSPELKARQRAAGFALYEALGIERRDTAGRRAQFARNYAFFDAPVGIVVTIDRTMGKGCFMDLGMALMSLLLAAEAEGLGATGIGALANYATVVHRHLDLPESEMVVCGLAVGHADTSAPINQFRTARATLEDYATLRGFEG